MLHHESTPDSDLCKIYHTIQSINDGSCVFIYLVNVKTCEKGVEKGVIEVLKALPAILDL